MKKALKGIIGLICIGCVIGGISNIAKDDKKTEIVSVDSGNKTSQKEISKDKSKDEDEQIPSIEEQLLYTL